MLRFCIFYNFINIDISTTVFKVNRMKEATEMKDTKFYLLGSDNTTCPGMENTIFKASF